ncbi:hypothetical protein [Alloactinosynnema sp. L-07]|uniref:caspase family protein n=1 Tax=Alloactinosynnema sp. L-07 TaxID=1653480 RepID=UPI00065F06C2|nr:caspase family protein [Alloactinosynnema sp. L-07]CRK56818.1 hypothetical protein [Alloactinosynnema sp. L-07]
MSSSSWALVMGCDHYWSEEAALHGAVRDALAMRRWLVDPSGGGVPPSNVILLLSPHPGDEQVLSELVHGPVTNSAIQEAHHDIVERSGGGGDRLYCYFAGHGLTANSRQPEPAIVPADFTPRLTDSAVAIRSSCDFFATTGFAEQFFFYDACRNVPYDDDFAVGGIARPSAWARKARQDQYVCYGTAQSSKAKESGDPGDESGAFTDALLSALAGAGAAKVWDRQRERYAVTWDSMFEFVERAVLDRRLVVGVNLDGAVHQRPFQAGEHGSRNPVLADLGGVGFDDEQLTVSIVPVEAAPAATVTVLLDDADHDLVHGPPAHTPHDVVLPPRSYTVRAQAAGFRPRRRSWYVELYGPTALEVVFDPGDPGQIGAAPPTLGVTRGIEDATWGHGSPGRLVAVAEDATTIVEVRDEFGTVRASSPGAVELRGTGWFKVAGVVPGDVLGSRLVEVEPGERVSVELDTQQEFPRRWTSGAVAAAVAIGDRLGDDRASPTLEGLDPALPLHVVVVDPRALSPQVTVRIGPHTDPIFVDRPRLGSPPFRAASFGAEPGMQLVTLDGAGPTPLTVPVHVDDGPSSVIVDIGPDSEVTIVQLSGALLAGASGQRTVDAQRFVEAQRFVAAGQLHHAWSLVDRADTSGDPLLAVLVGYLRLHLDRKPSVAGTAIKGVVETGLPDARLLRAWFAARTADTEGTVDEAARDLLRIGPPVFSIGFDAFASALAAEPDPGVRRLVEQLSQLRVPAQAVTTFAVGARRIERLFEQLRDRLS